MQSVTNIRGTTCRDEGGTRCSLLQTSKGQNAGTRAGQDAVCYKYLRDIMQGRGRNKMQSVTNIQGTKCRDEGETRCKSEHYKHLSYLSVNL